jgi:hypothetical protein
VLLAGKSSKSGSMFLKFYLSVISSVKVLMELTAPIPYSLKNDMEIIVTKSNVEAAKEQGEV